ncbi:MAG: YceH family protein, partial [Actinomycetota bacterium]|nr:YceH family protein [Actinomycetota bacterium]
APKYRHLLAQALPMSPAEQAIMCVLMLRGPQTPGELKQRTERMHSLADLDEVQETLARMMGRELVTRLQRRPGQKEDRYAQLLEDPGDVDRDQDPPAPAEVTGVQAYGALAPGGSPSAEVLIPGAPSGESLAGLHERVARLEREVADLRAGGRAADGAEGSA